MKTCRTLLPLLALAAALLAIGGNSAQAGPVPLTQVSLDLPAGDATFTVQFPHAPQFYLLDSANRPADSFQIELAADPAPADPTANLTSIIRGDEIHFANALRVRSSGPPDFSDPQSAGWGAIRGTVPFSLTGDQLTFSVPLATLGAPDGKFYYHLFTESFGVTQDEAFVFSVRAVPLPSALAGGLAMLGLVAAVVLRGGRVFTGSRAAIAVRSKQ